MLDKILKEKDLSYAWLARRLGVDRGTVRKWVVNKMKPKEKYFPLISKALNISEDQVKNLFTY